MTPEEKKEFEQLKIQVEELLKWQQERIEQQLIFPLDEESQQIIDDIL